MCTRVYSNFPHRHLCYASKMNLLRLSIIVDDPLARAGLAIALTNNDICLISMQMSSQDFLTEVQVEEELEATDVIVWDLGWDFSGSPPLWQQVEHPIIALVPEGEETAVLWAAGVAATLPRDVKASQIIMAARTVATGLAVFDPKATPIQWSNHLLAHDPVTESVTHREIEVLQRLARGLTNKAIAQELQISPHTIKFHVNNIMNKLNAQNRTEAVVKATRLGFISL